MILGSKVLGIEYKRIKILTSKDKTLWYDEEEF